MFKNAFSTQPTPRYLSSDNDPLFRYQRWQANLRILEIQEIKSVPQGPLSQPFVERLIGTIRRELLDQILFWNAHDLDQKLEGLGQYCNAHRVHTALDGDTPSEFSGDTVIRHADLHRFNWMDHCRGLYRLPKAARTTIRAMHRPNIPPHIA
jgi:hypothetical protein